MRFRPCIDLHANRVKQIVGSTFQDGDASAIETNFEARQPASYFAELYRRDGLVGGHVIMLGPGSEEAAVEALEAYPSGLQIGGGITPETAGSWLEHGAAKVIVTSYVFCEGRVHWDRLGRLVQAVGRERLVLDVSCRQTEAGYVVAADRWQTLTGVTVDHDNLTRLAEHCSEFLVHAVDVEGRQAGVDAVLLDRLANESPLPTTYAGGIAGLNDIEEIDRVGNGAVDFTVGSALDIFGGDRLKYQDMVALDRENR
ncbi:MAG: phosphoribosylformimino-5-aminoimidazole carboxamide ribotide isomerase [Lentisphaerae bacterium]|nr:phosphoribosylformimino-5-aminoimidazole carboxamide ribotide isomerase [Lentisphaerota bacterium]MBT4819049.1 phosphoribosylformimino-5-aminoimidazole carboxamide ribotide isomerase [Lentisphaerota bacterium]MBT5612313.1 phosphoribosylformimino-5-aminoimidazole carboxamide ribotide isomerase [Lentisphaerota bacterium]MBT7060709.1 phosphoribosylformimino-5-aminoimidazole carboxamide ribotide isomerase [Lentisphaerota bacterium]MBT7845292.1 phosphoribosylformimino-5-aminoimidazole carboxamide